MITTSVKFLLITAVSSSLLATTSDTIAAVKSMSSEEYVATSFQPRDGSTNVSVRLIGTSDNDTHGTIVFTANGTHAIQLDWKSKRSLVVSCSSCRPEDVSLEVVQLGNTEISYVPSFPGVHAKIIR